MCGILGVRRSFLDDPLRFAAGLAALGWRGPDGQGQVVAGAWRIGVARLAISDPRHGQPLWSADRSRLIAFNGAVTSAEEERRGLPAGALRTGNDAELVLQRLARGGEDALLDTSGHFALAILEPATDRLWLARDPFGEKPLFVVHRGGELVAFASSVASLQQLGIEFELSTADTARLLRFGFALAPKPRHDRLELIGWPSGARRYAAGRLDGQWSARARDPGHGDLATRVVAAARRCATVGVPGALSLSGGLDSSCLAVALVRAGTPLPAYQARAQGDDGDERWRATAVAEHCGIPLRSVDIGPEVLRALPALTRHSGMPLIDLSVLAVHAVARQAAGDGIRVLLSGEGADELFVGYRRHRAAHWLGRLRRMRGSDRSGRGLSRSGVARLWRAARCAAPYESLLEVAPPEFRRVVFEPPWAIGTLPLDPAPNLLAQARDTDRAFYLPHDLLPKLDIAAMAAGVESRCPFLDPAVVHSPEANADPRRALGKRALRNAFRADLPDAVLRGRKRGFALPLDRWLRHDDWLPDLLSAERTRQRPHLRRDGL
ncbi:MAG: asparagine synthetase B, partial [Planctomycetes bacterium]|nr:asparagine synthetase B [Planctomycetota bacterium]